MTDKSFGYMQRALRSYGRIQHFAGVLDVFVTTQSRSCNPGVHGSMLDTQARQLLGHIDVFYREHPGAAYALSKELEEIRRRTRTYVSGDSLDKLLTLFKSSQ